TGNGLQAAESVARATHLLLNPPYTRMRAPDGCEWATGNVSAAGVFLDVCLSQAAAGARIFAILPDVLRTGSRYAKWRRRVESAARIEAVEVLSRFDAEADVDVFGISLVAGRPPTTTAVAWWSSGRPASQRVDDYFEISVGAVVPHRHALEGPCRRYLYPR